ncbi:MAG TPA: hypothetical protein VMU51_05980 [Mycobacteriales bacterium]|nr:hypothetical protein [Mycobacteriales bacterium]
MNDDDAPWAQCSLRIVAGQLTSGELAAQLGRPGSGRGGPGALGWVTEFATNDVPLADQLGIAADFLRTHQGTLRALPAGADVSLRVSWTPQRPQDGLALSTDLIALLAAVHGYLLLDTFLD